ncbi:MULTISPECIES: aminoacyl-histidine dipeptidase [Clostridium]|uniref:Aminoacyl-histidine dipeptidase n=1 Tax=Clostridium cibarium TaxID=2762247 RepID=A0ABR8PR64_9CLOT|nr:MULTISPECIES: aminoacyl-histidine dipeptidase [Clostridium]MBD7910663.1 aminoacyl-histidine dipeptidase [Clostridium cibarium]
MKNLKSSKAALVFKYFEEISKIPRGSKNEKEISDYLMKFAKGLGLDVTQDKALNIIIRKPASKGYENAPTVILQGHMDMVCEKNKGTEHDFEKDPIKLVIKDDDIYADGTTLGADNGIAVAYAMAVLADDTIEHPAIEVLITTDEETGMSGAQALSKDDIKGKVLLNLDSEEEGYLLVSCAGGIRAKSSIRLQKEPLNNEKLFNVVVKGLKGGHSGSEIHLGRGNANKIMGRTLNELASELDFNLVSINGGAKDNAIPREADAIIAIDRSKEEFLISKVKALSEIIKLELQETDSEVTLIVEEYTDKVSEKLTKDCTDKIVDLLYLYPNGISTMSASIEGLVESSNNIGVVSTGDKEVEFHSAVRSSVTTLKEDIVNRIGVLTKVVGGEFEVHAPYPAWEYNKESKIRELCKDVYKKMYGKDAVVYALHAGVECGLFEERLGKLDMISFGPDIRDAHTPQEHLSISSTERVWEYLLEVLKEINNKY